MIQRLKIVTILFCACFLIIFGRLFYWQIINHNSLTVLAGKQYSGEIEVPSERGKIYSSDNFPLVLNSKRYLLFASPVRLKISAEEIKTKLEPVIGEKLKFEEKYISDKKLFWLQLAQGLNLEEKEQVAGLKVEGLDFESEQQRFYPEASMSAHLLGFVAKDENGRDKGYFGLEGYYDNELKGKPGFRFFEKDAIGRPIPLAKDEEIKPISGRDLILSIDRPIQYLAEMNLKEGVAKYKAKSGFLAIVNPKNGEILAMAAYPGFDLDKYYKFDEESFRNPIVSWTFEPGSIFKVIVMASALDAGVISPSEICDNCGGPRKVSDYLIRTWNDKYYPNINMTDILVHSDNVGMIYVMEKLGVDRFYEYLNKFGFNQKTGIDLQGEMVPVMRKKESYAPIDLATASFGQGIAVSPIQMLMAVSAIANKGEMITPSVVSYLKENDKQIILPKNKKIVLSKETTEKITKMMVNAVENGEAKWAKPKGIQIAGKTGTAQIPTAGHYDPEKTIASFVGFSPPEDPKFAMLVCLVEPQTSPWGSETAAPLWFKIADEIYSTWGLKREI